ncbi:MAG TPA: amidohydrolase [Chloroflexi bacterium]|jgi:predicted amidohydrolase YtcJ|nr:amidohydrolase [Chloroflexota bacterium]
MGADRVLYNGIIYTLNAEQPRVSALAVRDGRIIYAGDDATARGMRSSGGEAVDLRGYCAIPGLADAHLHFSSFAQSLMSVNAEMPTPDEALVNVAEFAARTPAGEWVVGRGWNHNVWGGEFPTAAQLDRVAPAHPVCLSAKSGHAVWVNSLALRMAGITAETADPAGGEIVRDASGQPTGLLLEEAMNLVYRIIPEQTVADVATAMADQAIPMAHRAGLTMVHDMDGALSFGAEQMLQEQGRLTLRVLKSISLEVLDEALAVGLRTGYGNDLLRIGQVKMFADGALGPRTSWMLEGFETAPEYTGIPTTDIDVLREAAEKANRAGLGCAIHAIGDRACREILDIYEGLRSRYPRMRNRIEHLQILHPDDFARVGRLGVIGSMQPIHATSDMFISDRHLGARAAGAYVFKTLLDQGAVLAFGSDCPVEVIDPLVGIHAAVTRRRGDGMPGVEGWYPDQRLTVEQAVRGFTLGAAYAAGMEDRLGSLQVGKLADVTILGQDIFAIDPMDIPHAGVMGTMVGGRFVWRDAGL